MEEAMAKTQLSAQRLELVDGLDEALVRHLLDGLQQDGVLNGEEVEEVIKAPKKQDQARILCDHVLRKGEKASALFLQHYRQAGKPGAPKPVLTSGLSDINVPSERKNGVRLCPPELFQTIQAEKEKEIYPIKHRSTRTRLALIICNIDFVHHSRREGAEVDVAQMTLLLEGLGYTVETEPNLTTEGMTTCLKRFAARGEHKTSDSTFVILMSHGNENGLLGVESRKDDVFAIETVFSTFNNQSCPALLKKPKVVIIQACRGKNNGWTYVSDSARLWASSPSEISWEAEVYVSDGLRRIHKESDFACLHSTTPDTMAWRSPTTGSFFIKKLTELMKEHAWHDHLEEIFRKVLQVFDDHILLQMPCKDRTTLTRKFYLFPGH